MKIRPTSHNITVGGVTQAKKAKEPLFTGALAAIKIVTSGRESLKGRVAPKATTPKETRTTKLAQSKTRGVPPTR